MVFKLIIKIYALIFSIYCFPERPSGYDAFEQTTMSKENGYTSPKTEPGLMTTQENWSKKKRKKKKPSVKTVVIEDQDDYGGFDETDGAEKESLPMDIHSFDEKNKEIFTKDGNSTGIHEDKKLISNTDGTQYSNTVESPLAKSNQSGDETVSDVRTTSPDSSSDGHVTNLTNDHRVNRTDDQSNGSKGRDDERTVFVSNDLDKYLTLNSPQNSETNSQTKDRNKELDSLGRIAEIASSTRQEFSTNDFLLDQSETQPIVSNNSKQKTTNRFQEDSRFNTKDSPTESKINNTSPKKGNSDFIGFQQSSNNSDSGKENSQKSEKDTSGSLENNQGLSDTNEKLTENLLNSKKEDSSILPKSNEARPTPGNSRKTEEHSETNEELSVTPKSKDCNSSVSKKFETRKTAGSYKEQNDSSNEFSEIPSRGNSYDYRVRKVENPEFISSSYGSSSAMSDFTDDDRDLNFIPGIHRISSKSFSSSFERKSTADSSVSFDENGFPLFESSHYTESSPSQPSSIDDASSSRFADLSNEWDMFEDLLNVEEEHFTRPDVS